MFPSDIQSPGPSPPNPLLVLAVRLQMWSACQGVGGGWYQSLEMERRADSEEAWTKRNDGWRDSGGKRRIALLAGRWGLVLMGW